MLLANEYLTSYYSEDRRALQLSKYYLSKWGKIEKNASKLNKNDKKVAYILYSTLNKMAEDERKFLANKYRVMIYGKSAKPDKELAEVYDMDLLEYRNLRKGIEYKFYYYLKPSIQKRKKVKGIKFKFG